MTRNRARLIVIVVIGLLVLVAAALYFINLYRDSIALEVARTALRDTDVQVSDVSRCPCVFAASGTARCTSGP